MVNHNESETIDAPSEKEISEREIKKPKIIKVEKENPKLPPGIEIDVEERK